MFQDYCEKRAFIIASSLMENIFKDFCKMVVDQRVPAIVMLCSMKEVGEVGPMYRCTLILTSACKLNFFLSSHRRYATNILATG